ncbi:hypothetical protein [Teredinibacter sp. KSP-S5-2]|uniref:hypothetical protein n=1 Tax=Teredinibacter sp. KSP-S5-2 TaxID=3034506 RepID=UPI002934E7F9|nr:hypothetical protein [Teredinibacter sp. KSP-S5-2]WNO08479.1 hypothetical protein P5V12_16025 [Teredinibacter sp. KSP-S5-2]
MKLLLKKKTKHKPKNPPKKKDETTCQACGYQRKDSDTNPLWQCPGCERAYSKVNREVYSQEEVKAKNRKYREREAEEKKTAEVEEKVKEHRANSLLAGATGCLAILHGVSNTCRGLVFNPVALTIGGVIILGALIYFMSTYSG